MTMNPSPQNQPTCETIHHTSRVQFTQPGFVEIEHADLPACGAHEICVATTYSTISPGTELAFLHAQANTPGEFPVSSGYTASARVIEVGTQVSHWHVGQTVAAMMPHSAVENLDPVACIAMPESIDPLEASAYRLGSIAIQGVRKAQIQMGETVVVFGLGVIGNLAGQLARAAGATKVIGIDPVDWRRACAEQCAFDMVIPSADQLPKSFNAPIVIEATGVPSVVNDALAITGRLGRVVLLGSSRGCTPQVDFYRDVHKKGITIVGAHESIRAPVDTVGHLCTHQTDGKTIIDLLASDRIRLRPLITDVMPARDAPRAYQRLTDRTEQLMTIALDWND